MWEATVAGTAAGLLATGRADGDATYRAKVLRVAAGPRRGDRARRRLRLDRGPRRLEGAVAARHPARGLLRVRRTARHRPVEHRRAAAPDRSHRPRRRRRAARPAPARAADRARPDRARAWSCPIGIRDAGPLRVGERRTVAVERGTVAVDGEREIEFSPATPVTVTLAHDGPHVLDVRRVLAAAARGAAARLADLRRSRESSAVLRPGRHPDRRHTRADRPARGRCRSPSTGAASAAATCTSSSKARSSSRPRDLHTRSPARSCPVVMGHEFAGVVSGVGAGVTGVAEGDRVAVEPYYVCGRVLGLRGRALQHLPQARVHRASRLRGRLLRDDGRRPEVDPPARRPPDRRRRARRAAGRRLPRGAAVGPEAGRHRGGRYGAGPIGLVTVASLKATGAGQVISVEPAAARKAKATVAGADVVLDPTETEVGDAVRDLTGGAGADVAFECAGIDAVLASAIGAVRPGGRVVNVAIWGHPATRADERPRAVRGRRHRLAGLLRRPSGHDQAPAGRQGRGRPVHHRPHRARRHRRRAGSDSSSTTRRRT